MLVGTFRDARLAILILVPFITIAVWLPAFFIDAPSHLREFQMPLFKVIVLLFGLPGWLLNIFAILLISAQAIYFNIVINNNEVLYKDTNLPALFYPLVISFMPELLWLHPILFVNLIMIFTLNRLFSTYKHTNPLNRFFDVGFLVTLASMFYFPAILLIFLVFASIAIMRPFVWREWVVSVVGLLLPFFFVSVYYFWIDKLEHFWLKVIPSQMTNVFLLTGFYAYVSTAAVAATAIILILAIITLRSNFSKNAIRTRDYQKIIISFLFISIVVYILTEDTFSYSITITALPVSILMAYYFLTIRRKWIYETLFVAWVITIIFSLVKII